MRLFIGIKLSEEVKNALSQISRNLKGSSNQMKWVKENNVHLTLKFLGKTDKKDQIISTLQKIQNISPFMLKLSGLGTFGRRTDLRVLWAGIERSNELKNLFNRIESSLEPLGFPPEKRNFSPHITLARNRQGRVPEDCIKKIDALSTKLSAEQKISSFQLFKSDLTISGPIYSILSNFTFNNN